jgi:hypothetical protein
MIETLGWVSTLLIVIGYWLNAKGIRRNAMLIWIIGDIGWILYDILIFNISHLALSAILISINIYGIYRIFKQKD